MASPLTDPKIKARSPRVFTNRGAMESTKQSNVKETKIGDSSTKKRTRRKPRNKTKKREDNDETIKWVVKEDTATPSNKPKLTANDKVELLDAPVTFNIETVKRDICGTFIKKRSVEKKKINLQGLLNTKKPVAAQNQQVFNGSPRSPIVSGKNLPRLRSPKLGNKIYDPNHLADGVNALRISNNIDARTQNTPSIYANQPSTSGATTNRVVNKKSSDKTKSKKRKDKTAPCYDFSDYFSLEQVKSGLSSNSLLKGSVRINPKNFQEAYISSSNTAESDYIVQGLKDRNRALQGDEVVFQIKPKADWHDGKKTAIIVYIEKSIHPKTATGHLKPPREKSHFAEFYPRDKTFPILRIPIIGCPPGFRAKPESFAHNIFLAKVLKWNDTRYAEGVLLESLGKSGNLKVETAAILKENRLDITPFPPNFVQTLPLLDNYPEEWLANREDLRKECIFTIDPASARDLDDAVSCKVLPNGNFEVGVHIADVTHYLKDDTDLNNMVAKKATTTYMVDSVYHMLPIELCLQCSLLPGKDKLAFSVIWEMTPDCEIVNRRFARTIINSCAQLSYEHAQAMIESKVEVKNLPDICNNFSVQQVFYTVNNLQSLAVQLRKKRFENGSLRIDQVKVGFTLDPKNGEPTGFHTYELKDAHRMIEEFMLLANISVAEKILDAYPELAFLRLHEHPKINMLVELQKNLETLGIHIDISTSKGIQSSFTKYFCPGVLGASRMAVLNHLFAKSMIRARYFCAGFETHNDFSHYALSVGIYTHFTSPIRRYADIMVHRILAASLGYSEKPKWSANYVSQVANNCNMQKYNAKKAGEASSELYLAHFVDKNQPFIRQAVVLEVRERSFDVMVTDTGTIVRLFFDKLGDNIKSTSEAIPFVNEADVPINYTKKLWKAKIEFLKTEKYPAVKQIIEMFSLLKVHLMKVPHKIKFKAKLLHPKEY